MDGLTEPRVILIDPDVKFGESFVAFSSSRDILVDHYRSVLEVGYLGRFKHYQVAILNSQLETMTGLELAEYFEKLLGNMPVVLLKMEGSNLTVSDLPKAVYRMIDKGQELDLILTTALAALKEFSAPSVTAEEPGVF